MVEGVLGRVRGCWSGSGGVKVVEELLGRVKGCRCGWICEGVLVGQVSWCI